VSGSKNPFEGVGRVKCSAFVCIGKDAPPLLMKNEIITFFREETRRSEDDGEEGKEKFC
jgi:hypothetical protein